MSSYSAQIGNIGPFDITSFSWGPQHAAISSSSGGTTQAQVSDVVISKQTDSNSALLAQACAAGTPFDSATITVTNSGGSGQVFQFSNVVIASFTVGGGRNQPADSMDWNFAQVFVNYNSMDNPDDASGGSWGGSLGQQDDTMGPG